MLDAVYSGTKVHVNSLCSMMHFLPIFILLVLTLDVDAWPTSPQKTCIVKASGTNETDDAPAIRSAFKECRHSSKIIFRPTTYYVNSVLNISGLEDVDVEIQGKLLVR